MIQINWQSFRIAPDYREIDIHEVYLYICRQQRMQSRQEASAYLLGIQTLKGIVSRQAAAVAVATALSIWPRTREEA